MQMFCAIFLHLLTPVDFISFSVHSEHRNFGLLASFTVLSSDVLSRLPAHSSLLTFIVVTVFGFLYITCNSSLVKGIRLFIKGLRKWYEAIFL